MSAERTILVFGATGQQGGSVANALLSRGWQVKAFVRDANGEKVKALTARGAELAVGNLADAASIEAAVAGVYGVFSVQPSSGQGAVYDVSDEDEIRYGSRVADIAVAAGVQHLVYSSANAAGEVKTGMGHFDSKAAIEAHIRTLALRSTIIRPSAFMQILMLPGLGLDQGILNFFMRPDQAMQFIAVEDIGKITASIFAHPDKYESRTMEIAGDSVTGIDLQEKLSRAAGRAISYRRFSDDVLEQNPFLRKLAALLDDGRLAGRAYLDGLRRDFPDLLDMEQWLAGPGEPLLRAAMQGDGAAIALR